MDNASGLIAAALTGIAGVVVAITGYKRIGANERIKTNLFGALLSRWRDWAQTAGHYEDVPQSLRDDTSEALDGEDK